MASLLLAQVPVDLNGKWRVSKMNGKSVSKKVKPPTVEFLAEGRVAGFGGCNRFGGAFSVAGSQLKLGDLAATRMACAGDGMAVEDQFFKLFAGELKMKLSKDRIELANPRNENVIRLQRDR